jgi:hypothetical protein
MRLTYDTNQWDRRLGESPREVYLRTVTRLDRETEKTWLEGKVRLSLARIFVRVSDAMHNRISQVSLHRIQLPQIPTHGLGEFPGFCAPNDQKHRTTPLICTIRTLFHSLVRYSSLGDLQNLKASQSEY